MNGLASNSTMYNMIMPISFLVLYISENVRNTIGSHKFSATVTAERNQVGRFSKDFKYVLNLFYKYVKEYHVFGADRLRLKYRDVFLHLRQNVTEVVDTSYSHCTVSTLFVIQSHKNLYQLNTFMARCLAANHMLTKRYPKHWHDYYILIGLREYYTIFLRLEGGGVDKHNDFTGIGPQQVKSFLYDDTERDQPAIGLYYTEPELYLYMNSLRGKIYLRFM